MRCPATVVPIKQRLVHDDILQNTAQVLDAHCRLLGPARTTIPLLSRPHRLELVSIQFSHRQRDVVSLQGPEHSGNFLIRGSNHNEFDEE